MEDSNEMDVESLRNEHESPSEWEKRRLFLETHKDKFDLDRLVCLSNCYINVDVYGSRYPAPLMKQLRELCDQLPASKSPSKGKRKVQLISFTKASDSTEPNSDASPPKKGKGFQPISFTKASDSTGSQPNGSENLPNVQAASDDQQPETERQQNRYHQQKKQPSFNQQRGFLKLTAGFSQGICFMKADSAFCSTDYASQQQSKSVQKPVVLERFNNNKLHGLGFQEVRATSLWQKQPNQVDNKPSLGKRIRWLAKVAKRCMKKRPGENAMKIIDRSAEKCHMDVRCYFKRDNLKKLLICRLEIDGVRIASAMERNKNKAKQAAYSMGLKMLRNSCMRVAQQTGGCYLLENANKPIDVAREGQVQRLNTSVQCQTSATGNPVKQGKLETREPLNSLESLSKFVLINHKADVDVKLCASQLLMESGAFNKVPVNMHRQQQGSQTVCQVYVDGSLISSASDTDYLESKRKAALLAFRRLRQKCYMINVKQFIDADENSAGLSKKEVFKTAKFGKIDQELPESNVGHMLLKKMGWGGGGIGKEKTGIAEPIRVNNAFGRAGLGNADNKDFSDCIRNILEDYVTSDNFGDIHFSNELTKKEREIIHRLKYKYNLKTISRGKGEERFLVVSRKWNAHQLMMYIKENGGSTNKYDLIPPEDTIEV